MHILNLQKYHFQNTTSDKFQLQISETATCCILKYSQLIFEFSNSDESSLAQQIISNIPTITAS